MNPKHVVSLEIAKQLKEAGWKKETEFWWNWNCASAEWILMNENMSLRETYPYEESIAAPLATEILEELPELSEGYRLGYNKTWWIESHIPENDQQDIIFAANILPDALAKMWLWLKKEKP